MTLPVYNQGTKATVASIIADGIYLVSVAGLDTIVAEVTTYGTGNITMTGKALPTAGALSLTIA